MKRISIVQISGLFGYAEHTVYLREEEPTVLTGPNGTGKTHILTILDAALNLDVYTLQNAPFKELQVTYQDGEKLHVRRDTSSSDQPHDPTSTIHYQFMPTGMAPLSLDITPDMIGQAIQRSSHSGVGYRDIWRDDGLDNERAVAIRYRANDVRYAITWSRVMHDYPELKPYQPIQSTLIDTKRLESSRLIDYQRARTGRATIRDNEHEAAAIQTYVTQMVDQVNDARRRSMRKAQSTDLTFAERALAGAHASVKLDDLRKQYSDTNALYAHLAANGLASSEVPIGFEFLKANPTERRILRVFLEDLSERLQPLLSANDKIEAFRSILDEKFSETGKSIDTTDIGDRGRLVFRGLDQRPIPVERLSSGEQHLIAIFATLLFSAPVGSIVLLDEPEISLHYAWQTTLLNDLREAGRLNQLQIVLATHSPGVIQGEWDLVEELQLPSAPTVNTSMIDSDEEYLDVE